VLTLAVGPTIGQHLPSRAPVMRGTSKAGLGATVVNEANETVGAIDDLIVTPEGQTPYAVLSVGGFLGIGTKYVVLPFTSLKIVEKKIVLPGGTKDALEALPEL
jgi:hypothetical protein